MKVIAVEVDEEWLFEGVCTGDAEEMEEELKLESEPSVPFDETVASNSSETTENQLPSDRPRKLQLSLPRSSTIVDAKKSLATHCGYKVEELRLYFRGCQVPDDWHIGTNFEPQDCLVFTRAGVPRHKRLRVIGIESLASLRHQSRVVVKKVLSDVQSGFTQDVRPELSEEGSGGTYFLKNANAERVACFKPADEEPCAENNPRVETVANQAEGRQGVLAGEAVHREVAAFITDTGGFSGVPETIMVEIAHPEFHYKDKATCFAKTGSLQRFVDGDLASDFSPHLFSVDEVHKIGVLDLRLLNSDRNDANLLVSRMPKLSRAHAARDMETEAFGSTKSLGQSPDNQWLSSDENAPESANAPRCPFTRFARKQRSYSASAPSDFDYFLTPIDHGYCLPDRLRICWYDLCWLDWPQTRQPFSEKTKAWIRNYDIDANVNKLRRELNIREPCLHLIKISGLLLKKGVEAGLCLHDIASILVRQDTDTPSILEKQIARSIDLAGMLQQNARVKGAGVTSPSLPLPPTIGGFLGLSNASLKPPIKSLSTSDMKHSGSLYPDVPVLSAVPRWNKSPNPMPNNAKEEKYPELGRGSTQEEQEQVSQHFQQRESTQAVPQKQQTSYPTLGDNSKVYTSESESDCEGENFGVDQEIASGNVESRRRFSFARTSSDSSLLSPRPRVEGSDPALELNALTGSKQLPPSSGTLSADSTASVLRKVSISSRDRRSSVGSGECIECRTSGNESDTDEVRTRRPGARTKIESSTFKEYFFEYLDRLLADVILSVKQHRESDSKIFCEATSFYLTSPHRAGAISRLKGNHKGSSYNAQRVSSDKPSYMMRSTSLGAYQNGGKE
eukprot:CAMPEP_0184522198 /NCGR_PEP_ID=MMETSP0198_2-20121128/8149_1 /TAXON_ID=1112570 /ORGANISM="Thraustochytrium sp., Strain LLF1b" /LENGTH=846 /DNA_ID=CAMNT_0026912999 /DNA_START=954 /DNA_END=3494 /DNA_ORIENTATION=+